MSGLNGLFGIGSNAVATFQRALSLTGQNIANVSTAGYSRQEITLSESLPENGQPGQIGTGVTATEIRRSVDSFVERQLLSSNQRVGQFGASQKALSQIQLVFNVRTTKASRRDSMNSSRPGRMSPPIPRISLPARCRWFYRGPRRELGGRGAGRQRARARVGRALGGVHHGRSTSHQQGPRPAALDRGGGRRRAGADRGRVVCEGVARRTEGPVRRREGPRHGRAEGHDPKAQRRETAAAAVMGAGAGLMLGAGVALVTRSVLRLRGGGERRAGRWTLAGGPGQLGLGLRGRF